MMQSLFILTGDRSVRICLKCSDDCGGSLFAWRDIVIYMIFVSGYSTPQVTASMTTSLSLDIFPTSYSNGLYA